MQLEIKLYFLIIFCIINLSSILFVKTRTDMVLTNVLSCLVLALFFSMSIPNYQIAIEIILTSIIYFSLSTFLLIRYDKLSPELNAKKLLSMQKNVFYIKIFTIIFLLAIFFLTLYLVEDSIYNALNNVKNYEKIIFSEDKDVDFFKNLSSNLIIIIVATTSIRAILSNNESI